jgi:uncharacterized membrane protein
MSATTPPEPEETPEPADPGRPFSSPEIGAIAHLYRGEIYRSTIWRTRLDATTNWSVVSLGIALSLSYSSPAASPLPLFLVALLIVVFLYLESRRYRYFNVWRARARWLELNFYAPLLRRNSYDDQAWKTRLAEDYERPEHHINFRRALGRRLRRNYMWIFSVQFLAFFGKVVIHPTPLSSTAQFFDRLRMGPLPGWFTGLVILGGYVGLWVFTIAIWRLDKRRFRNNLNPISMG